MRKIFLILLFGGLVLQAGEILHVENFKASIFSKHSKEPVKVEFSLIFEGRDVDTYDFKIVDALNIVVGSFFVESLLTSKGKEGLKQGIINYARDKHSIDIDYIFIQKLNIVNNITARVIIDELRREGYIRK